MLKYVYGTKERIFVNTVIGCHSSCHYCYLPSIYKVQGYMRISADDAINRVNEMKEYSPGKKNTIISLGCYSECMFSENVKDTMEVIHYFCKKNNYIQLATKQKISENVCKSLVNSRCFKSQINVYISMPTYSKIQLLEPETASLEERINNIFLCKKYGINVILYIKPFLENITYQDEEYYIDIARKYNIPIVVGGYLSVEQSENMADVGEQLLYGKGKTEEMELFIKKINAYTDVYEHSTDFINDIRRKENMVNKL